MEKQSRFLVKRYRDRLVPMLLFNIVLFAVLGLITFVLKAAAQLIIYSTGRSAVTSGDIPYLFTSWQGVVLMIIGLFILAFYVVFDIHGMIIISSKIVNDEKIKVGSLIKETFTSIKKLLTPMGVGIILFVVFIAPLFGGAFGVSLTANFSIPDFILSVIIKNIFFRIAYYAFLVAMAVVSILYMFVFHFILFEGDKPGKAMKHAKAQFKKNWKYVIREVLLFLFAYIVVALIVLFVIVFVPVLVLYGMELSAFASRFVIIFAIILNIVVWGLLIVMFTQLLMLKLTEMHYVIKNNPENKYSLRQARAPFPNWVWAAALLIIAISVVTSGILATHFEELFPPVTPTQIIAHRGAGTLSTENTVESVGVAASVGAYASETDVQRTKDGYYIINHDGDFNRLCGDSRKPSEMTLEEIKQLRVKNTSKFGGDDTEVATLEEMLDAAKGKVHLYVELKGETADEQMADDVYDMIASKDMLNECTIISLNYPLIKYVYDTYPEADTSYLLFVGLGDIGGLDTDGLAIELESLNDDNVESAHDAGKRLDVWTCNTTNQLAKVMLSPADGVITDQVDMALKIQQAISMNEDAARILASIILKTDVAGSAASAMIE